MPPSEHSNAHETAKDIPLVPSGHDVASEHDNIERSAQLNVAGTPSPTPVLVQAPPRLPPEVLRYHLSPLLSSASLRAFRLASRDTRDDAAVCAITAIRRAPGTHPLPPDLGTRFPRLTTLDLSGDTQLLGGLSLFRALQSATGLTSLDLSGCSSLPASFVVRQLPEACLQLQHLALSCCCSAPSDAEPALMAALAAAPLAASLTSLDLHCGGAFQPELAHLGPIPAPPVSGSQPSAGGAGGTSGPALGRSLRSLRIYGSRTLDDDALEALPFLTPSLTRLALMEQHTRRGRHIRGGGLAALRGLAELRELSLGCHEPSPRDMAAALAALTQLTELDLSRCEPALVEALAPLAALLHPPEAGGRQRGGGGGDEDAAGASRGGDGPLQRLLLPTAYTAQQLARSMPAALGAAASAASAASAAGAGSATAPVVPLAEPAAHRPSPPHAAALRSLRLHTSSALPEEVVGALAGLAGLQELSLAHSGTPGAGAAAAAAEWTALTALHLVQEYGGDALVDVGAEDKEDCGRGGAADSLATTTPATAEASGGASADNDRGGGGSVGRVSGWYGGLPSWRRLRQLVLTGVEALDDVILRDMGGQLNALTLFSLSRSLDVTGAGFASWPSGCPQLTSLALYDCARVGDAALTHLAALPRLRNLALAHLPAVGAAGIRHLAIVCTTLRNLTFERLAGVEGEALAELWRLPLLEALSLRMCSVTNLTLQTSMQVVMQAAVQAAVAGAAKAAMRAAATATATATSTAAAAAAAASAVAARTNGSGETPPAAEPTAPTPAAVATPGAAAATEATQGETGSAAALSTGASEGGPSAPPPAPPTPPAAPPPLLTGSRLTSLELQGTLVTNAGLWALRATPGLTHLDLSSCPGVSDSVVEVLLHGASGAGKEGGGAADGFGRLLPCLVHLDLRGCKVGEPALERLRAAGLAVNTGLGLWR